MDIKPIRSEADYFAALEEIEKIFNAEPETPEGDKLEILIILVGAYEEKYHKLPLPDPIDAIEFHMERMGLSRKDLEQYIGNRARVSEVLNRRRPLSLRMIRKLSKGLGIPSELLIQEYPLNSAIANEEDAYNTEARVASILLSGVKNFFDIFKNPSSQNQTRTSLAEIFEHDLQNPNMVITGNTSNNDCFYVSETPLKILNWPGYTSNTCGDNQRNKSGNSRLQRIEL